MESVCRKAHHVFFPAGNKQQVAFGGQLVKSEAIIVAQISGVKETHLRARAVDFNVFVAYIAIHRFLCRFSQGIAFPFLIDGTERMQRPYIIFI